MADIIRSGTGVVKTGGARRVASSKTSRKSGKTRTSPVSENVPEDANLRALYLQILRDVLANYQKAGGTFNMLPLLTAAGNATAIMLPGVYYCETCHEMSVGDKCQNQQHNASQCNCAEDVKQDVMLALASV